MSAIEALILGVIQGITEFLPVSSSGHLALGELFFGYSDHESCLIFNIVLHLGTLVAIIIGLSMPIVRLWHSDRKTLIQVAVATLPLFPLALAIGPVKAILSDSRFLGYSFLVTAALLFAGERFACWLPRRHGDWKAPLTIGIFQAAAVLPGLSRSGSTISAARMLGWSRPDALFFSFMMAIPAITGAIVHEGVGLLRHPERMDAAAQLGFSHYLLGFAAAFVVGSGCFRLINILAKRGSFLCFGWYCLAVGIVTIIYTTTVTI